ncbi:hypothetical protein [Nonomuraea sp. NPDC023979]|uniref:hypothetical protein n=1 Tax=Nonomuraea sp. NPDC023979 TaxID=3154796 RepID=UPI0033D72AA6
MSDRDKDVEILALRHQIMVLERRLGADVRVRFTPEDRFFLATLLTSLPRAVLRRLRLVVRPDPILRWHREIVKRQHARTCLIRDRDGTFPALMDGILAETGIQTVLTGTRMPRMNSIYATLPASMNVSATSIALIKLSTKPPHSAPHPTRSPNRRASSI